MSVVVVAADPIRQRRGARGPGGPGGQVLRKGQQGRPRGPRDPRLPDLGDVDAARDKALPDAFSEPSLCGDEGDRRTLAERRLLDYKRASSLYISDGARRAAEERVAAGDLGAVRAEERQMSVVFTDIVGFTRMSGR